MEKAKVLFLCSHNDCPEPDGRGLPERRWRPHDKFFTIELRAVFK